MTPPALALYSTYDYLPYPEDPTYPDETYGEFPECGDEWGMKAGSWALTEDQTGFNVLGVDKNRRVAMVEKVGGGGGGPRRTVTFLICQTEKQTDEI